MQSGWSAAGHSLLAHHRAPHALPILAVRICHPPVALEELVGDLEHRQHQAAVRAPGDVAASGLAPDELALLDLEALGRTLLVDQAALQPVGLLDLHVL